MITKKLALVKHYWIIKDNEISKTIGFVFQKQKNLYIKPIYNDVTQSRFNLFKKL